MDGPDDCIRPVKADDHAAMAALQAASFPDPWSVDAVRRFAELPGAIALVAEGGAGVLGYLLGQVVTDEAEVHSLAVAAAARRRGLGRCLLASFEGMAAGFGARSVVLEVAADDPAATGLYESAGYRVVAIRPGYYRAGRLHPVDAEIRRRALR